MCSTLYAGGDGGGSGAREVAELDKLLSSAHFDNNQHVQAIAGEEQRTAAAQKQLAEKQADIKALEESISRCDSSAKELHQRLKQARENSESSKRTAVLLDEHIAAMQRKMQDAKETRERKRQEKESKIIHYQQLWEQYERVYSERALAKQLSSIQISANDDVNKVHEVDGEVKQFQDAVSSLTITVNNKNEMVRLREEAKNLDYRPYVIEMAKNHAEKQVLFTVMRRLKGSTAQVQADCITLEQKKAMTVAEMEKLDVEENTRQEQPASNLNQATFAMPPAPIPTQPRPYVMPQSTPAPRPYAMPQSTAPPPKTLQAPATRPSQVQSTVRMPPVDTAMCVAPPVHSTMPPCTSGSMPLSAPPSSLVTTAVHAGPESSHVNATDEPEPMHAQDAAGNTMTAPGGSIVTATYQETASAAHDGSVAGDMRPPPSPLTAPSTPKTPQAPSAPRQGRQGLESPGFGLQKPASPLDSFQYAGRPMFNSSATGALASPTAAPTSPGMPFFQTWNGQKNKDAQPSSQMADTEAVGDGDPTSGFLALAASLAPSSSSPQGSVEQQQQQQASGGGGLFGSMSPCNSNSTTQDSSASFSMFASAGSEVGSGGGDRSGAGSDFSFSFGGGGGGGGGGEPCNSSSAASSTPDSGMFSFSFGGSSEPEGSSSSQSPAGFSFGGASTGDTGGTGNEPSPGFSFGAAAGSPQSGGSQGGGSSSGFSFAFGAASPQRETDNSANSMFSLF
ncbi:uncharacterized protein LOC135820733 [Sycon ciliatum]|uniref:uncharacterized protein LOC135820733 n=1 Tax=Sycon ciliatum TaxID=27933 RepID=UPI0031F6D958